MANEAFCSVTGYVATQPQRSYTTNGTQAVRMRVGWTPRVLDRTTGEWVDQQSSFVTVWCYRKLAENAAFCLRKGDAVVIRGSLRVRDYEDQAGARRISVEVVADTIGHDLSHGTSLFARSHQRLEQTAVEHERAMAAAGGREQLPGDSLTQQAGQLDPGGGEHDEPDCIAAGDLDPDNAVGPDGDDEFETAGSMAASAGQERELAGAAR